VVGEPLLKILGEEGIWGIHVQLWIQVGILPDSLLCA
jgi:hypothetical protein